MEETQAFHLPEHLDLTYAAPLQAHLTALLGEPLVIDAAAVQKIGGLCLQVLLAAGIAWNGRGQKLRIVNESSAFTNHIKQMGIDDLNAWIEERRAA